MTGSTKITLKGKAMTLGRILGGDRVHIGGTVDSSGAAQRLIALRVIIRPRHSEIDGSFEDSSTPPESDDTSPSVDSSDTTPLSVNHSRQAGTVKKGAQGKSVATAIISWLRSLF